MQKEKNGFWLLVFFNFERESTSDRFINTVPTCEKTSILKMMAGPSIEKKITMNW